MTIHGNPACPTPQQLAWQDLEIGLFVHFDLTASATGHDWQSFADYPSPEIFQPARLDTDQWLEAAVALGAKYAVLTAKHAYGFCLWPTDAPGYEYSVKYSSWRNGKGDVVADFIRSCGKYGVRPGLYYGLHANGYMDVGLPGIVNRGRGGDPAKQRDYARLCEAQLTELWSRYGELTEIWFDGGVRSVENGGPDVVPLLQKYQPNAVAFQGPSAWPHLLRWVGNERGVAPYPCWSATNVLSAESGTEERKHLDGHPDGAYWAPAEVDVPIRKHQWMWAPGEEHLVATPEHLLSMYYQSVGRNGNWLLNANPNRDGLVPEPDFTRYREVGDEIRRRFGTPLAETSGAGETHDLNLPHAQTVDHAVLQEDIREGERIRRFVLEGEETSGAWRTLVEGSCISHKRIAAFAPLTTARLRLRITEARGTPTVRRFAAFRAGSPPSDVRD